MKMCQINLEKRQTQWAIKELAQELEFTRIIAGIALLALFLGSVLAMIWMLG